jgi:beta-glucoside operon transcriptional antiterminator
MSGMAASSSSRDEREPARKVLNNNVVVTIDSQGRERVLMGRGIGFQLKASDLIDNARIEKTFVLDSDRDSSHVLEVFATTPYNVIEAVTAGIEEAERSLGRDLGRAITVAVMDHIRFVLERLSSGLRIPTAAMPELGVLYPDEFRAAEAMAASIGRRLEVDLPPEETFFLATHLLNATREDSSGSAAVLFRRVQHVVATVETFYGIALDKNGSDYARFVLHVKFLLQRLVAESMLSNTDSSFYDFAVERYPKAWECAELVHSYVSASTGSTLTKEEILYLIVHIERITQRLDE